VTRTTLRVTLSLGLALTVAVCWLATLLVALPPGAASAQEPSPRPPLSATDIYLTSIAPQPTQPGQSGGGQPAATNTPAASSTASPAPPRATRSPSPTASAIPTETPVQPTSTPVVVVQTVVLTVVQTVMQTVVVNSTPLALPTAAPQVAPAPATPVSTEPGPWVWLVAIIPLLALVFAVLWVIRSGPILPGWYPDHGRPRHAGLLPGRKRRANVRLPE